MAEVIKDGDQTTVILDGDIVAGRIGELREQLQTLAAVQKSLVLDFNKVDVIDSTGVGLLISTQNLLKRQSGKLSLRGVSNDILRMLKIMRLDRHLDVTGR